jgi:hypothetical protein
MTACWTSLSVAKRAFQPGASSMLQRDENHLVPGQGCREDGPVPPNCSAVTTRCSFWTSVLPLSKAVHQTQMCFCDMTLAPYTTTSWQWISAGDVPFSRRNLITLRTSMFDHVSVSPAILQPMLGQYDWYEAWSSVCEREQCSTCSDLAGNLNEIRNIHTWEVLLPYLLNCPRTSAHMAVTGWIQMVETSTEGAHNGNTVPQNSHQIYSLQLSVLG